MPLIIAAIVSVGTFIGYTLNDIDSNPPQTKVEIRYLPAPEQTPLIMDFRCEENKIGVSK